MPKIVNRDVFFSAVKKEFGEVDTITRPQVLDICTKYDIDMPHWFTNDPLRRVGRGIYKVDVGATSPIDINITPEEFMNKVKDHNRSLGMPDLPDGTIEQRLVNMASALMAPSVTPLPTPVGIHAEDCVPKRAPGYVSFGHFNDVRTIVASKRFYPIYITGLSGNGKTMMVEQVHAETKRECIRVNITIETDEDDLLGGFRLVDGRTVWQNGPVIHAMEKGATLLLDEVDLGSNKLMCLQPVLEGRPIFLKKINKTISPAPGFNVIATANTKGKGSDDGRFIGTNVMNEAFLERFSITMEQEYPSPKIESKILQKVLQSGGVEDNDFVSKLVSWAEVVRKSFAEGACTEIISTRRLVHICEAYMIFNKNRMKAIELCLNRFDVDTKNSFLDLYKKLDEAANEPVPAPEVKMELTEEIPF